MRKASILAATLLTVGCAGCGGSVLENFESAASSPTSAAEPSAGVTPSDQPATDPEADPQPKKARKPRRPTPTITVPDFSLPATRSGTILGADVSWPQCPEGMGIPEKPTLGLPMPLRSAEFVVLGLTNGPAFTPNPCLGAQVDWVRERHLWAAAYAVHSFPDDTTLARYRDRGPFDARTRLGALSNVGYQQALFNIATMRRAELATPAVWLDVEPVPIFAWSEDREVNAAVVTGAARGYTDAGFRIGVYSTTYLWSTVVGSLRLGVPEWRAAGQTSRAEALRRCGRESTIQGGRSVLSQWVASRRDLDVTCPGTSADMSTWFFRY